jgi:SAM-dependent methyltransferase
MLAKLEDTHWWYKERRVVLGRELRRLTPGRAVDVGAAAGGNTRVLQAHGWQALALEYTADGAEIAHGRGVPVVRGDALRLPVGSECVDLVVYYDVLEHIEDDKLATAEMFRALKPGGTALIAVPADPRMWSAHDEAVSHVRRYTRQGLVGLVESAGFEIEDVRSWNVLLKPVAVWHRRKNRGSDHQELPRAWNSVLGWIVALERYVPAGGLPGVSLMVRARRPQRPPAARLSSHSARVVDLELRAGEPAVPRPS